MPSGVQAWARRYEENEGTVGSIGCDSFRKCSGVGLQDDVPFCMRIDLYINKCSKAHLIYKYKDTKCNNYRRYDEYIENVANAY